MKRRELALLEKYFHGETLGILVGHSTMVAELALAVCQYMGLSEPECRFVEEAAMLHDIGVCRINAPKLGLYGEHPYIMHGILGREILEAEGLPQHALVCERHIGVGITEDDIIRQELALPLRDMSPQTTGETIVCFADLFYSKSPGKVTLRKSPEQVRNKLSGFGVLKVQIFDNWLGQFGAVFAS